MATGRAHFACQEAGVFQIFILIVSNEEKILGNVNGFCEDKLKGKTAHLRLLSSSLKTRVLLALYFISRGLRRCKVVLWSNVNATVADLKIPIDKQTKEITKAKMRVFWRIIWLRWVWKARAFVLCVKHCPSLFSSLDEATMNSTRTRITELQKV